MSRDVAGELFRLSAFTGQGRTLSLSVRARASLKCPGELLAIPHPSHFLLSHPLLSTPRFLQAIVVAR